MNNSSNTTQQDDLNEAVVIIRSMATRFQKIEPRAWGAEGTAIELTKQVGELCALIMSKEGYYFTGRDVADPRYAVNDEKLADEMFDILFALVRLADHYGINLTQAAQREQVNNLAWFSAHGITF